MRAIKTWRMKRRRKMMRRIRNRWMKRKRKVMETIILSMYITTSLRISRIHFKNLIKQKVVRVTPQTPLNRWQTQP